MSSEVTIIEEKSNNSKNIITYSAILVTFLIALWLSFQSEGPSKLPKVVTDEFTFTAWVNDGEDYLKKNYRWFTKIIAGYIKNGYYFLEDFLIDSPWLFNCGNNFFTLFNSRWFKARIILFICDLFLGWNRYVG